MNEKNPAAYAARCKSSGKWYYIYSDRDSVQAWVNLQHQSRDDITFEIVPLFYG